MNEIKCTACQNNKGCPITTIPGSADCLRIQGFHPDELGGSNSSENGLTDSKKILAYLEDSIQLERNVYIQKLLINEFDEYTSKNAPILKLLPEPIKPTRDSLGYKEFQHKRSRIIYVVSMIFAALILFLVSGASDGSWYVEPGQKIENDIRIAGVETFDELIATRKTNYNKFDRTTYEVYLKYKSTKAWEIRIALLFLLGSILPTIIEYSKVSRNNSKVETVFAQKMEQYQNELKGAQANNPAITAQFFKDKSNWTSSRSNTQMLMQSKLKETQNVLTKLYSKNLIYPEYQNLSALTSIYEYITTGKCLELTGPLGAYNLYEEQLRNGMIISNLDLIMRDLQQIKQNQDMLYHQLTEVKREVSLIRSDLTRVNTYTYEKACLPELNAYYNRITASNAALISAYGL